MADRELSRALAKRLVRERRRRDIQQGQVAARMGVRQATLSRWERGHVAPSLEFLIRWANALDLDLTITIKERTER